MSIHEIVKILTDAGIEKSEADAEVKILLEHYCNFKPIDIIFGKKLDTTNLSIVREEVQERIKTGLPIQYIMGFAYFMNEKFLVNKHVLIPRDDTEILVTKAIELILKSKAKKVLDIGTGSGCIACIIARDTQAEVLGLDISNEALSVALENANRLSVNKRTTFRQSDLFANINKDEKFDVIVSNPPYIPISDKSTLQKEVLFEPEQALFTNDEKGLTFYQKIIENASKFLNNKGLILFEVGIGQSEDVKTLLLKNNFRNVKIEKDVSGTDRVVIAQR